MSSQSTTPNLTYLSQTPEIVSFQYADMPVDVTVVFVNKTSGKALFEPSESLGSGGSGSGILAIGETMPSGGYFLAAQDENETTLAQTVEFYITGAGSGGGPE